MSLLAPLYFIGALAVGLPVLFHLIRRQPKGKVFVSSLMFIQPTTPRLTRRSRLENLPLLLVRCLALILLALAFARPFLRDADTVSQSADGKRIVMLIDRSASMRQQGVWAQAKNEANATIQSLGENDQIAIVAFDNRPETLMSFKQSMELNAAQRKTIALEQIQRLKPSWRGTDLGDALRQSAELAIVDDVTSSVDDPVDPSAPDPASKPTQRQSQVVLISDLQSSADLNALQAYPWPETAAVELHRIDVASPSNASAFVLTNDKQDQPSNTVRVRVQNNDKAQVEQFRLHWLGQEESSIPVQVPAGESRVVSMPAPDTIEASPLENPGMQPQTLVLSGDDHDFDNQFQYYLPPKRKLSVLFIGPPPPSPEEEAAVRESLSFFLFRVPLSNPQRDVNFTTTTAQDFNPNVSASVSPLVVVGQEIDRDLAAKLKQYVANDGRLLVVVRPKQSPADLAALCDSPQLNLREAEVNEYAMLRSIVFSDPIFASMSDPQFNDFTKVRIWKHRIIDGLSDDFKTLAQFDDGSVALAKRDIGSGTLWILNTGWMPSESQLALSTKFLPMMHGFFDPRSGPPTHHFSVDGPFDFEPQPESTLIHPSGDRLPFQSPKDRLRIDQPGIYSIESQGESQSFAVNMNPNESQTNPMAADALEQFGISLDKPVAPETVAESNRQLRDIELESKQKWWQWLLAATAVLIAIEIIWGGRLSHATFRSPNDSRLEPDPSIAN